MKIKFKKLNQRASIPSYANEGDAGMDLVATTITRLSTFFEYGTDLSMEIPKGYVGLLFPRSSISNTDHYLRNSVGVIDSGYRGEIKIRMSIPELYKKEYNIGDKIAQLVIIKLPWVDIEEVQELGNTDRGERGFGSSGK
jgi:dUTP pyrophosphatase